MKVLARASRCGATWLALAAWSNVVWWFGALRPPVAMAAVILLVGAVLYVWVLVRPTLCAQRRSSPRGNALGDAEELITGSIVLLALAVLVAVLQVQGRGWPTALAGLGIALLAAAGLASAGFVRVAAFSSQVGLGMKAAVLLTWWLPPVSLVLLCRVAFQVRDEQRRERARMLRDLARLDDRICATRYPLVLVHGIFFRDWDRFGYWGRIPRALERNGARVFYAGQQSASSVEGAAAEIAAAVAAVCARTGAQRVNVIAHSKGGLDVRWAVSRLGLADKVASVTTVCTPHRGTPLAGRALDRLPDGVMTAVGRRYEAAFTRLGDDAPDFVGGVRDLSPARCVRLSADAPDVPGVVYRSVGARMGSARSAPFPLNAGFVVLRSAGPNDGLVPVTSMAWGESFQVIEPTGREGISHGDMIDLRRRDVAGFDVCECYVQLVATLKTRGL